jgi:hypothetical protein
LTVKASNSVTVMLYFPQVTFDCRSSNSSCISSRGPEGDVLALQLIPRTPLTIGIAAPIFTFGSNGESAEGWLPNVNCSSCSASTVVKVVYEIPNAKSYDWTSGPPPGFEGEHPVWMQYVSQLQEPVYIAGSNPRVQQQDQRHTFYAGIAVGIAGALFASSLQALLPAARRRADRNAAKST